MALERTRTLVWLVPLALGVLDACGTQSWMHMDMQPVFLEPTTGDVVSGEAMALVAGNFSGQTRVLFQTQSSLDAAPTTIDEDRLPPYQAWIDTSDYPDGTLVVSALIGDPQEPHEPDSQAAMTTIQVAVILDNHGPEITLLRPTAQTCIARNQALALTAAVDDAVGISIVEFRAYGEPLEFLDTPPYEIFLSASTVSELFTKGRGQLSITVAAENTRGLISNLTFTALPC